MRFQTHEELKQVLDLAHYALAQAIRRKAIEDPEVILARVFSDQFTDPAARQAFAWECLVMLKKVGAIRADGSLRQQQVTPEEVNDLYYLRRTQAQEAAWQQRQQKRRAFHHAMEWATEMIQDLSIWRLLLTEGEQLRRIDLIIQSVPRNVGERGHKVHLLDPAPLLLVGNKLVYEHGRKMRSIPSVVLYTYYQGGNLLWVINNQ